MAVSKALVPQAQPQLLCWRQRQGCRQAWSLQWACGRGWCWWQRGYGPLVLPLHHPLPLPLPIKLAADPHSTTPCDAEALQVAMNNVAWVAEAVSAQGCFRAHLCGRHVEWATWHCCDSEMDVRGTLWAFLVQGEGSPRRQIRACASLQERLEKKTNQRCALWGSLGSYRLIFLFTRGNQKARRLWKTRRDNGAIIYSLVPTQEQLKHTVLSSTNNRVD